METHPGQNVTRPLVSVLMPAYNAEKYISEALDSVLAQTYPRIEIIVVNDGSSDGTAGILDAYRAKGVLVIDQANAGQCAAANCAFRASRGEYIKFFDADDVLSPETIAAQVKKLGASTTKVCSTRWGRFYDDNLDTFKENPEDVWRDMDPAAWLTRAWERAQPMMQCALWLIPRQVLSQSGLWDERLSLINDFEFFTRVLLASDRVLFEPGGCLYYRSGMSGSLSATRHRKAAESAFLSITLGVDRLLSVDSGSAARRASANMLQGFCYQFYTSFPDLTKKAEEKIDALGGSDFRLPGGKVLKFLNMFLGWKKAKRIQSYVYAKR